VRDQAIAAIAQTAIDLGRRLGVRVVPGGVEADDTLALVSEWDAGGAQGFYIIRPLPADELEAWLRTTSLRGPWKHWTEPTAMRASADLPYMRVIENPRRGLI
jgi:predicted signal transduction protein with EAL and GGDEF domain